MPPKKLKPNQPCHCGSGKKYKKCCKVDNDISSSAIIRHDVEEVGVGAEITSRGEESNTDTCNGPPLRFRIGERVLANVSHAWLPGTVVDLRYREPGWPAGRVSPYQILLDDGDRLIHAPFDGDNCIKRYDEDEDESARPNKNAGKKVGGKKKKKGKSQLREEARRAEDSGARAKGKTGRSFIPEDGDWGTIRDEFTRSGMTGSRFLVAEEDDYSDSDSDYSDDSFSLKRMVEIARWKDLRIPDNANEDATLTLLTLMFRCIPRLRNKEMRLNDDDVEMFLEPGALEHLPSLLRMCVAPEQYSASDEGLELSDFVWDCITLLSQLHSHSGIKFQIDGPLAKHLCSISRICLSSQKRCDDTRIFVYETIDPLFDQAGESAFLSVVNELYHTYPCRGHIASLAIRTMDSSWVQVETHVDKICNAISAILIDPRTSEETNGEMFAHIDSLLRNPHWVEHVLSITLDSLRHCQIHLKLDTSIVGGFDSLIKTASETIAAASGKDDELFLLKEIFRKDTRGIEQCYCPRHPRVIPRIVCDAEHQKEARLAARSMVMDASTCIIHYQYDKALEITSKAIEVIGTGSRTGGKLLYDLPLERKVHSLRGHAQLKLGKYEDALYSIQVAIGGDPAIGGMIRYEASKLNCDSFLDGIRTLVFLGRVDLANVWSTCLQSMKVIGPNKEISALDLAKAQSEANGLVSKMTTKTSTTALIDSEPARKGIPFHVRQCTWRSVGKFDEEDDTIHTATHAVPRLNIVLVWVRGKLLIWNYQESKVIQWVHRPSHENGCKELFHTTDSSSIFVFYDSNGFPYIILLDNLHRLQQGGTCTAEDAMLATLGIDDFQQMHKHHLLSTFGNQTPDDWYSHLSALRRKFGKISTFAAAKINDTKGWNLAMVMDSANLGILLFTGHDTIAPGVKLGPFAFLEEDCSFILKGGDAHTGRIYELMFVDDGNASTLVSSAGDKSIKIWNIASRSCQHTIRGFSKLVRTLACTPMLLFGAADDAHNSNARDMEKAEELENGTFGSHSVNVWEIRSGQHLATLRSKSGKRIDNLITIPQQNILLSGHQTGEVHVWRYDQFRHIQGFKVIPSHSAWGISFHLHRDYIAIMSMTHLILFKDPVQLEVSDTKEASLPLVGDLLNCGNCGLWKIDSSSRCSRCRQVSFCDRKCLKEAWPKHKTLCHKHR